MALFAPTCLADRVRARGEINFAWVGGQAWKKSGPIETCAPLL